MLCLSICLNTSARPTITRRLTSITNSQAGDRTECALLEMAFRMGYDYKKIRNRENQLLVFPFSPEKKKMATVCADDRGSVYVFVKGAPEFLLPNCNRFINRRGTVSNINQQFCSEFEATLHSFASESLRTILLAYKEVREVPDSWREVEEGLILIGLVGIKDPLRDGIP
jgi:magnesium-transporting ATPase (P-type)